MARSYRRTVWVGMVSTALLGGCYSLPTVPPAASAPVAVAVLPPPAEWPATTLPGPAGVAVADGEQQTHFTADEAARSRAELQRLKQEILSLRERLGKEEKENLKTIRSIMDALDQVMERDQAGEPGPAPEKPAEAEPPTPVDRPELLPQLPPLKRNG